MKEFHGQLTGDKISTDLEEGEKPKLAFVVKPLIVPEALFEQDEKTGILPKTMKRNRFEKATDYKKRFENQLL